MAKKGFGGGMMPGNMNQILKHAQKMQDNMQKMQQELEAKEFEVSVGGGAVTVKVNGKKEVLDVTMKPEVVDHRNVTRLSYKCCKRSIKKSRRRSIISNE